MIDDDVRDWLVTETAKLIERRGIDSYVAAPLVEATDRWFPDAWHPDDTGVVRLANRVLGYAGIADAKITGELGNSGEDKRAIEATVLEANALHVVVDPTCLTDPLTAVAELVHIAAYMYRLRYTLCVEDAEEERKLVELTAVYLGFGIIMTNAAYRYRAEGEIRGNTAYTRWSHDEQGVLPAHVMAYALAMQLVARGRFAAELRAVRRQLETNQAVVFDEACRELEPSHVIELLGLPNPITWPARREPPPKPASNALQLFTRDDKPNLPVAMVKNRGFLGHNTGKPVLRTQQSYTIGLGFLGVFLGLFAMIPFMVTGQVVAGLLALLALPIAGFVGGHRLKHDVCAGRGCGGYAKLTPELERCPRCGGTIVGRMLPKENLLEAEERLQLDQGDDEIDVGEPSESVELPAARVTRDRGDAGVDGSTNTGIG